MRRIHASFIREAGNLASKSEYAWLNAIIYLYIAQKMEFHGISKNRPLGSDYYNTNNNNSTSMAEPGAKAKE